MRDRLAGYDGLNEQPIPGTAAGDALQSEIEFMLLDVDHDTSKQGRDGMARPLLRFMVARGYWPLGTRCEVTKKFRVKTKFPRKIS